MSRIRDSRSQSSYRGRVSEAGAFGRWTRDEWGLPAFRFEPRVPIDRHGRPSRVPWYRMGNDELWVMASAAGWVRLFETARGRRAWHDQAAYAEIDGISTADGAQPTFGAGYVRYLTDLDTGLSVDRLVLAPFGSRPFVLCRIEVRQTDGNGHKMRWHERWPLRPFWLSAPADDEERRAALGTMRYRRVSDDRLTVVEETRDDSAVRFAIRAGVPLVPPPGGRIWLAWLSGREAMSDFAWTAGDRALSTVFTLELESGAAWSAWQVCGVGDPAAAGDLMAGRISPEDELDRHFRAWRGRHVSAAVPGIDHLDREVEWAGMGLRQACVHDSTIGTFVDPGGRYAAPVGFAVARDVALCGIASVYTSPEIARSTLLSLARMSDSDGEIPWATFGAGIRHDLLHRPADFDLWVLWLALEYLAGTGDIDVLDEPVECWPQRSVLELWPERFGHTRAGPERSLGDQLAVQVVHLAEQVGVGPTGLIRAGVDPDTAFLAPDVDSASVESVPVTAQARWVLPRIAAWFDRVGEHGAAKEALELSDRLAVPLRRAASDGHWPETLVAGHPVERRTNLAAQLWPVIAGVAPETAESLLAVISATLRPDSPLGCRNGPAQTTLDPVVRPDHSALLVWAAARHEPELAREELGCMRLSAHSVAYPKQWIGTFCGADAWQAPEAAEPGCPPAGTDDDDAIATGPGGDAKHPASLILATVRLFGIEPGPDGHLRVAPSRAAGGCRLRTPVVEIDVSESGRRFDGRYRVEVATEVVVGEAARTFAAGWNQL